MASFRHHGRILSGGYDKIIRHTTISPTDTLLSMAKPTCMKCSGTEFERQYGVVSNKGVFFINYSSCGAVINVIDKATEDAIEDIERKVR